MPIRAEALPACAAWRDRAPTEVLPLLNPWQLMAITSGATSSGRMCTPLNATTVRVVVAASEIRLIVVSMNDRPNRGSRRALTCEPAISPQEHRPKISANCAGDRPKPWMNTGADPAM